VSPAALSIAVYSIYLFGQGAALLLVPNTILPILGLPQATDFWIRIVGLISIFFGAYYVLAARMEWRPFFELTIVTRALVVAAFMIFAVTSIAPGSIVLLAPADVVFTIWTWVALRRGQRVTAS
jgi:hypothetical protein